MILLVGNDHRPAYKRLARALRDAIVNGVYEPGRIAFSAADLTEQLGVSRNTVDLALHRLAQEGLMVSAFGRGWMVTERAPRLAALMLAIDGLDQDLARASDDLAGEITEIKVSELRAMLNDLSQGIDDVRTTAAVIPEPSCASCTG